MKEIRDMVNKFEIRAWMGWQRVKAHAFKREEGIDGILVTVGLCIIALLLCVVMKDSLTKFINTIVESMTNKAGNILQGK